MTRVTFVFPTAWDRKQLAACRSRWDSRYVVDFGSPDDADCAADFDVLGFIESAVASARAVPGMAFASSSDYPGAAVVAAIARGAGLPGARPEAILRCSNKYAARVSLQREVPEAVPEFALVEPPGRIFHPSNPDPCSDLPVPALPFFVKPVRGAFSAHSGRIESAHELDAFLSRPCIAAFREGYLELHRRLQQRYAPGFPDPGLFLAESILRGVQVTVEGFVFEGHCEIVGIVDSIQDPRTGSFLRFEYPSSLPAGVQERMAELARRAAATLELDGTMFNIEMIYDAATGAIGILEVNPRLCGQFADLYEKVDGRNGYEIALALASGGRPPGIRGRGTFAVAASVPLRVFEPLRVLRAPDAEDVAALERQHPGTLVWVECTSGQSLSDFDTVEDGRSIRYAVVNLGATSREAIPERIEAARERLGFRFEPLTHPTPATV